MMEKNFDNKYRLDRGQLVAKVKEHYNYKRKIARGTCCLLNMWCFSKIACSRANLMSNLKCI